MNELKHHGVKGMRWGHRKVYKEQLRLAKSKYKEAKDENYNKNVKAYEEIERPYKKGQKLSDADIAREIKADNDWVAADKKAKETYKSEVAKAKSEYKNARAKASIPVARKVVNVYEKASYINLGAGAAIAGLAVASMASSIAARSGKSVAAKYATQAFAMGTVSVLSSAAITKVGTQVVRNMLDRKEQKLNNKK